MLEASRLESAEGPEQKNDSGRSIIRLREHAAL